MPKQPSDTSPGTGGTGAKGPGPAAQKPKPATAKTGKPPAKPAAAGKPASSGPRKPPAGPRRSGGRAEPARVSVPRWLFLTLVGVTAALVVSVVVLGVQVCSLSRQAEPEPEPSAWVSPYDWDNLMVLDNGLLGYYVDGRFASEAGVDVSEHDGVIDWAAAKASGIDFAMIRVGYRGYGAEGTIVLDSCFVDNIVNAKAAGVKVGVYFFSQAVTEDEAREEAQFVIDQLAQVGVQLDYPVAFDQEPITNGDVARTDNLSNEQLTANALAFCQTVERAGYTAMIYGNQYDLAKLDLTGALAGYDVWLAEYEVAVPTAQTDFVMWQYTEHGTVSGIPATEGWTDVNIRFLVE